ncbi:hypothetical protein AAVH_40837, partial [Aphelenchoides avenae]
MMPVFLLVGFAAESVLWLLHFSVTVFVARQLFNGNRLFSTAFYKIYFVQSIVDLINYFLTSLFTKMLNYGVLQNPYYMEGFVLSRCFFFSAGLCCFFQCISHCAIAVNRYTVFMHPMKHESIWRGTSFRVILSTMFFISALAAAVRLAMVVKVVPAGEGHGLINLNPWVNV